MIASNYNFTLNFRHRDCLQVSKLKYFDKSSNCKWSVRGKGKGYKLGTQVQLLQSFWKVCLTWMGGGYYWAFKGWAGLSRIRSQVQRIMGMRKVKIIKRRGGIFWWSVRCLNKKKNNCQWQTLHCQAVLCFPITDQL